MTEPDTTGNRFRTAPVPSKWPPLWRVDRRDPTALVTFDCGHDNEFDLPAPLPGERAYCRRCRTDRRVTNNPKKD